MARMFTRSRQNLRNSKNFKIIWGAPVAPPAAKNFKNHGMEFLDVNH